MFVQKIYSVYPFAFFANSGIIKLLSLNFFFNYELYNNKRR